MKTALSVLIFLFNVFLNSHHVCARNYIINDGTSFEERRGFRTYYHVTHLENILSVKKKGLKTEYGGKETKKGMSQLHETIDFKQHSQEKVFVTKRWKRACEYCHHMALKSGLMSLDLQKKLVASGYTYGVHKPSSFPVILAVDAHKKIFLKDERDEKALCSKKSFSPQDIFVLVVNKDRKAKEDEGEDEESFWIPIVNWNPDLYQPAYPDNRPSIDFQKLKNEHILSRRFVQENLQKRLTLYSYNPFNGFSQRGLSRRLSVAPQTLKKFLENDLSLSFRKWFEIMNNFYRIFPVITSFDHHYRPF